MFRNLGPQIRNYFGGGVEDRPAPFAVPQSIINAAAFGATFFRQSEKCRRIPRDLGCAQASLLLAPSAKVLCRICYSKIILHP